MAPNRPTGDLARRQRSPLTRCGSSPPARCPSSLAFSKPISARKCPASWAANETIDLGAKEALFLLAIVSLSLGLINLFPFLPLDGGHIFWSLVEKARGRPVAYRTMERAGALGFVLVIMLFALGLTNDIGRLTGEGFNVR